MSRVLEKVFAVFAIIVFLTILINHGAIKFDLWDKFAAGAQDAVESEQGQQLIDETKDTAFNVADIFLKKFRSDSEKIKKELEEREEAEETTSDATTTQRSVSTAITQTEAKLITVVDGDTIIVSQEGRGKFKVRLIGVDTPESVHEDESKNNEYGVMASSYTKTLLKDADTVYLQYDVSEKDDYDRDLCYVWLKNVDTADTQNIANYMLNGILLRNGYAYNKEFTPNVKYSDVFLQLREEAQATKAGLWQYSSFEALW